MDANEYFRQRQTSRSCVEMKAHRHSNVFNLPRLIRAGELTVAKPLTLYLFDPIIDGTFLQEGPVEALNQEDLPVFQCLPGEFKLA